MLKDHLRSLQNTKLPVEVLLFLLKEFMNSSSKPEADFDSFLEALQGAITQHPENTGLLNFLEKFIAIQQPVLLERYVSRSAHLQINPEDAYFSV